MCKPEINFIKSKKEPVKCSIPKKFLICPLAMMMAIPEVKPVITGEGISEIKIAAICSDPQNIDFSNLYFGGLFLLSNIP